MKILVTGTAGFIGHFTGLHFAHDNHEVVGIDNINHYYDVNLKLARLKEAGFDEIDYQYGKVVTNKKYPNYRFIKLDLTDAKGILELFEKERFDIVIHLAAQAGVKYSLEAPQAYIDSNITGTLNILEGCRHFGCKHLLFASSSSVYGLNEKMPFSESDNVDRPMSIYAVTKKSNELMAHSYAHLYGIPCTGLRFFSVYGPWGRPDMALWKFTENILAGKPITLFNNGKMERDFTYIDDVVSAVSMVVHKIPEGNIPYRILNVGNGDPVELLGFVKVIEENLNKEAIIHFVSKESYDVEKTFADSTESVNLLGKKSTTSFESGIKSFIYWFLNRG